jgi:tetratricopeptide (TPR) repeat protein
MPDFFISYNKADREWAEWIAGQLEKDGFSTVLQAWDFRPGCNFVLEMQKATQDSERTIAVISPDFLTSLFTKPEWAAALVGDPTGEERKLLPVRVRECKPGGLLKALSYIDLVDLDEEAAKNALLSGVKLERAKPSSPPCFPNSHSTSPESKRPRFPGSLPPIWNVPQLRNPNFTGREKILTDLHDNLNSDQATAWIQALTGLGGKGKTSLAREYAYRYRAEYDLVWWVRASEPATLAMDFSDLARELDLPQKDSPNQNAIISAVKRWLEQNQKWLLIFDNAQEPDILKRFLPQGGGGHVIITSRNPNWGSVANRRDVEVFEPKEAVEFILKRTNQDDETSAELLAEVTGLLPLALEQAGAYIEETGTSLSDYLIRFKKHRKTALGRGKPADYPDTVATTWEISFQAVKEKLPASAYLLNLCAFLAPDDIPKSLILGGAGDLPEPLASSTADEFAFDEIVAELRRYSLISGTGNKFSVHQLVQAVTRDRLTEDEQKNWSAVSVRLLNSAFQFDQNDVKSWENFASLLPHALASAGFAEELGILSETIAEILNNAGRYQQHLADFDEARKCLERALKIDEKAFGLEHPNVATMTNNLGGVLKDLGEMEKAKSVKN